MKVIDVDAEGRGPGGETYDWAATDEMIAAGLAENVVVCLRHPNGTISPATEVRITPKGMRRLKQAGITSGGAA